MTRPQALSDIVWALILTILGALVAGVFATLDTPAPPQLLVLLIQGLIVLGGLRLLLSLRGQRWRDLGLRRPCRRDLLRTLIAFGLMFAINVAFILMVQAIVPSLVETHQERLSDVAAMLNQGIPFVAVIMAMFFVGFYEELLARGFLLKRCQNLLGGTWGPIILSSMLFGLGHFYQGLLGILQTTLLGIVFASLALRWQTLWPLILAHALLNSLSLGLLRQLESQGPFAT